MDIDYLKIGEWVLAIGGFSGIAALITVLVVLRKAGPEIRKINADAAEKTTAAALSLIDPLKTELDEYKGKLEQQKSDHARDMAELRAELERKMNEQGDGYEGRLTEQTTIIESQAKRLTEQDNVISSMSQQQRNSAIEVEGMRAGLAVLISQLKEMGVEPRYIPPLGPPSVPL